MRSLWGKSESVRYSALFTAYMFLYTTTFQLGSHGGAAWLAVSQQELLYYIHQIFAVLGFVLFALTRRFLHSGLGSRIAAVVIMTAYAVGMTALFIAKGAFVYLYIASMTVFCLGFLGGLVYWWIADTLKESSKKGTVMGVGCATAYALQFVLQLWRGNSLLLPPAMLAAYVALIYILRREHESSGGGVGSTEPRERTPAITLVCVCTVTAALILLNCYYDGYIEQMQVATGYEAYDAFEWPRLLLVPFCLFFGLLGDVKRGKYLPLVTLCASFITLLSPALTNVAGTYRLNMCLFYIGVAAAISYYNLTFCNLAPRTRFPELWAGMGHVIDGGVGVLLGLLRFSDNSTAAVTATEIAALAALVVAMALGGDLNLTDLIPAVPAVDHVPVFAAADVAVATEDAPLDPFAVMQSRYALSLRETEVLRELVLTEDKQSVIGGRLSIKISTLQGYVTRLYRKTGTKTRAGLTDLYHETLSGH